MSKEYSSETHAGVVPTLESSGGGVEAARFVPDSQFGRRQCSARGGGLQTSLAFCLQQAQNGTHVTSTDALDC